MAREEGLQDELREAKGRGPREQREEPRLNQAQWGDLGASGLARARAPTAASVPITAASASHEPRESRPPRRGGRGGEGSRGPALAGEGGRCIKEG